MKKEVLQKVADISNAILAVAGIAGTEQQGYRAAGFSKTGKAVFVQIELASKSDITAGSTFLKTVYAFVEPFHVIKEAEMKELNYASGISSNRSFLDTLDKLHRERKGDTFSATFIKGIEADMSNTLAATVAVKVYDHWGVISDAQKSMLIADSALQLYKTADGQPIAKLKIVSGLGPDFTIGDALGLISKGANPYPLILHWTQIYRLVRVYNDNPSIEAMVDFATSHKLLGSGPHDAAVTGISAKSLAASGAKPAPQYGVGALAAPQGKTPPQGYSHAVALKGGNIIVPSANAKSAAGALSGSLLGSEAGKDGASSDASAIYSKWNKKDAKSKDKGILGGSAFIAGLNLLKRTSPHLYSAMIAFITRYVTGDVETASSSEYFSYLTGIALGRIVSGKKEYLSDKEGLVIARAVQGKTPADFAKLQVSLRALYAQFGVSSKADAYQLANQAYAEGRDDESDLVAMHEIFDIIYGVNTFDALALLIQGKSKGIEIARKTEKEPKNTMTAGNIKLNSVVMSALDQTRKKNAARYNTPQQQPPQPQGGPPQQGQPPQPEQQAGAATDSQDANVPGAQTQPPPDTGAPQ